LYTTELPAQLGAQAVAGAISGISGIYRRVDTCGVAPTILTILKNLNNRPHPLGIPTLLRRFAF
jgi:hypothetical protein